MQAHLWHAIGTIQRPHALIMRLVIHGSPTGYWYSVTLVEWNVPAKNSKAAVVTADK